MQERFQNFTVLIAKISRSIRKIKTEEMDEFNLKSPHVSCLYYLYKSGPLTAKEICDICQEDKASISRNLTKKGQIISERIVQKIDSILDLASVGLSDEERTILYKSLALISDNLEKICEKYGG